LKKRERLLFVNPQQTYIYWNSKKSSTLKNLFGGRRGDGEGKEADEDHKIMIEDTQQV